jgi:CubicO group peptidase (beta-lactamase class C family)
MASRVADLALDRFARGLLRRTRTPGLVLRVARERKTVLDRSFGVRDADGKHPPTPSTIFGIASVTKSFTAACVMRLAEEGKLRVTDPVVRLLPEFRTPEPRWTRRITLQHFLTHSSGLPPLPILYWGMENLEGDRAMDRAEYRGAGIDLDHPPVFTFDALLECLASMRYRLLGPPGSVFSYSNDAFALLGAIVERVSGQVYERYVEDTILRPAGMRHTSFDPGIVAREREVTDLWAPVRVGGRRKVAPSPGWHETTSFRPSGGLRSNVEELLRYLEIYRTGGRVGPERVLASRSVKEMVQPRIRIGSPGAFYGYGLLVLPEYHGGTFVGHSGGLKGVASYVGVVPERGLTAVALANYENGPSSLVLHSALNVVEGRPATEPLVRYPRAADPGRPPSAYAGLYGCGEGWWVRVRPRRKGLVLDFTGIELTDRGVRLRPVGPNAFVSGPRGQESFYRFLPEPSGRFGAVHLGWRVVRRRAAADRARARAGTAVW